MQLHPLLMMMLMPLQLQLMQGVSVSALLQVL
jgi:hypothetical protein